MNHIHVYIENRHPFYKECKICGYIYNYGMNNVHEHKYVIMNAVQVCEVCGYTEGDTFIPSILMKCGYNNPKLRMGIEESIRFIQRKEMYKNIDLLSHGIVQRVKDSLNLV